MTRVSISERSESVEELRQRVRQLDAEAHEARTRLNMLAINAALKCLHESDIEACVGRAYEDGTPETFEGALHVSIRRPSSERMDDAKRLLRGVEASHDAWLFLASEYASEEENSRAFAEPHFEWCPDDQRVVIRPEPNDAD
jgi:hypothetical protein